MSNFTYEVKEHLTTLTSSKGYTLEVNRINYGGAEDKIDIRRWDKRVPEAPKMMKGITLKQSEYELLQEFILQQATKGE